MDALAYAETPLLQSENNGLLLSSFFFSNKDPQGYVRLNAPATVLRKRRTFRLARLPTAKKRSVRVRRKPRFRFLPLRWLLSPLSLLAKLQEAYIALLQATAKKANLIDGISSFPSAQPQPIPSPFRFPIHSRSMAAQERELNRVLSACLARARSQHLAISSSIA
ncbi:hypothetical protein KP509_09G042400 [Ceratopteris richardii]|uniref:Uncharacterized protein n=1 Tax=Ceratopteris richardii TaxID=49495 RepID=A0A8T2U3R5_CERRI|nr:hypothetical protein KP509_09G042400 [Ceratopteris richardii]